MANLQPGFDQNNFLTFLTNIGGGDLNRTKFYQELKIISSDSLIFLNTVLGIPSVDQSGKAMINIDTFYQNWSDVSTARDYGDTLNSIFFADVASGDVFSIRYSLLQELSAFLIQYYFFIQKSENDPLPKIVNPGKTGYYQQTDCFYSFFSNINTRGIGNFTTNGMCDQMLQNFSSEQDRRTYVSVNPEILGWCGCFTPQDPDILEIVKDFPPECDPLCVNGRSMKLFSVDGTTQLKCQSPVCVISEISLNVEGSTNRQFHFNQICNGCSDVTLNPGKQPCRCVIDSKFSSLLTKIGADSDDGTTTGMDVSTTFEKYCPNSICFIIDETTGQVQTLACNKLNPSATGTGKNNRVTAEKQIVFSKIVSTSTIALLVGLGVVLISMCLLLFVRSKRNIVIASSRR